MSHVKAKVKSNTELKKITNELRGDEERVATAEILSIAIVDEEERKRLVTKRAWDALEVKLNKDNPPDRLIELVLSPKFPKTSINLNVEIDGMDRGRLIDFIKAIK